MIASVSPLFGTERTFERPREGLVERLWLADYRLIAWAIEKTTKLSGTTLVRKHLIGAAKLMRARTTTFSKDPAHVDIQEANTP